MSKEITVIQKKDKYEIHTEGINFFGERKMMRLGNIVYREMTQTYGFSLPRNVHSVSVEALEEVVDFMKELTKERDW